MRIFSKNTPRFGALIRRATIKPALCEIYINLSNKNWYKIHKFFTTFFYGHDIMNMVRFLTKLTI